MSSETQREKMPIDHIDSFMYMMFRRVINEQYAEDQYDFNRLGMEAGRIVLGRDYVDQDLIVDIGSSTGQIAAEAADSLGIQAKIIGIEPDTVAVDMSMLLTDHLRKRIQVVPRYGEDTGLATNSAVVMAAHNVVFRAQQPVEVLRDALRYVQPGGVLCVSSNSKTHGVRRHQFEKDTAESLKDMTGLAFETPAAPAEGYYLHNLPDLFEKVPEWRVIDGLTIIQNTRAVITPGERLETYLDSIKFSAANVTTSKEIRKIWGEVVEADVRPVIESEIASSDDGAFYDTIHRGMFTLQNLKTT